MPTQPLLVTNRADLRRELAAARAAGHRLGLVPTMGALHAGHLSLIDAARRECEFVVATIFVNPTQFGPHEDFTRYPRDLEADMALLAERGTKLVYAPPVEEVYRPGHRFYVEVSGVSDTLEGACRPGHFRGVATVVLKLLNLIAPDIAFFGQKDYQQSLVIRRLADDFDVPTEIRVCPIVRDADGLALSSRNVYLSAEERRRALALSQSLRRARQLVAEGVHDADWILEEMNSLLAVASGVQVEYAVLADADTLAPVQKIAGSVVALIAAKVGATRLIDNEILTPSQKAHESFGLRP